jgi:small subunit ribosomal protein S9
MAEDEHVTDQDTNSQTPPADPPPAEQTPEPTATPAAPPPEPQVEAKTPPARHPSFTWGTGRRKSSVARVRIRPGSGEFKINGREVDEYFRTDRDRLHVRQPLDITNSGNRVDVFVNVIGGGTTGQAGAIVLGLARALKATDPSHEAVLRDNHLLTRDARKVERKKYGRAGARRSFQFSKR